MKSRLNSDELRRRAQQALANFVTRKIEAPPWANRKVVIYGAGGFGKDLASALIKSKATILGFVDQKGTGQVVYNELRAYNLQSDVIGQWLKEKPVIVIGVFNFINSIREIGDTLIAAGFSTVITPMELYLSLSEELGWRYWLGTSENYTNAFDSLEKVLGLWADEESQRQYLETLLFRLEGDLNALSVISNPDSQYADSTVPRWKEPLRMVDGGACHGDAVRCLASQGYKFDSIFSFEPDETNFEHLRAELTTVSLGARISIWPCGLWSSSCKMMFWEGGGASSRLADVGTSQIPVVALDDVLIDQQINLIKLDIEGAEPAALQGAKRIISKDRPGLAICLYHYPNHLWTIPLWAENLGLGYRLYYRAHQQNSFDTIMYAVPQ